MRVKRLTETAQLPTRGSEHAAGLDLYADCLVKVEPGRVAQVRTGVAIQLPTGSAGFVWPRSGLSISGVDRMAGLIDCDYRGEIVILLTSNTAEITLVKPGDRIAQLVVQPVLFLGVEEVQELDYTERGAGGFGSTGV